MAGMFYGTRLSGARPSGDRRAIVRCLAGFCLSAGMGLAVNPFPALAQSLQGTIKDRASGLPVPGMVIFLLDSSGAAVASTLSDEKGTFVMQARSAGTYRLRAEAVGVFSETTASFRLMDGESVTHAFVFGRRTRDLPPVRIVEKQRCVAAPEAGIAVAALWDEVRKALTATELTTAAARYRFNLRQYERELDLKMLSVKRSRSWERVGLNAEPYGSITADSLAAHGYVQVTTEGTWYYAPDARTFLSDAFMRTHCLRLAEPNSERPGLIGLAFEPVAKRERPDVRGVLWLDARTSELQYLEFGYTGLPKNISDHNFGGRVEFARLPAGAWVVQRWHIRMPKLVRELRYKTSPVLEMGIPPRMTPVSQEVVTGIIERGGEVKDRVLAHQDLEPIALASLGGSVFDSTTGVPLAQANIWLDVPGQAVPAGRATTDSVGRFRVDSIAPGAYIISITHPRLDTLGASLEPVSLSLERGESVDVAFSTPSAATIGRTMCPAPLSTEAALVRGSVRREPGGPPVASARVVARWNSDGSPIASGLPATFTEVSATSDPSGHFTLCGLPRDRAMEIRAADSESPGEPLSLLLDSAQVTVVELFAPEGGSARRGTAVITGMIAGVDAKPIASAEVRVFPADVVVRTNSRGEYRVSGLAAGRHLLEARALGYGAVRRIVMLGSTADTVNVSLPQVRTLRTVTTTARRDPYRTGFYDRMKRNSGGHFLPPARINASGTRRVTELLSTVPGVKIRKIGQMSVVELTGRGVRSLTGCPVVYFLDGLRYLPGSQGLDGEIGLDHIEAIEVYTPATVPARFSGMAAGCGVVLLWTREKAVYAKDGKEAEVKPVKDALETAPKDARKTR
ncbi:MAG TPA: carboxypeptidase regulatory-like domain-containing protein [Gemmatimonadaceae bacterium]|nr:carboxypeptidase regulatory-like domain-containing protein [Gemmatimonadaceae bacterium]